MTPRDFYTTQLEIHKKELSSLHKKLRGLGALRLFLFLATVLGIYFFFDSGKIAAIIAIIGIVVFLYLVVKYTAAAYERNKCKALIAINETEIRVLNRDFHHLPSGDEFKDDLHAYSQDVDLFGKASFFQYINRTRLKEGKSKLAAFFLTNSTSNIIEKQTVLEELSKNVLWRQDFAADATLLETETSCAEVVSWLKKHQSFVPKYMKYIIPVISIVSLMMFVLAFFDMVTGQQLLIWFFVGGLISISKLKKINDLAVNVSKIQDTFEQYYRLLEKIENTSFKTSGLKDKQEQIKTKSKKASEVLKEFSKLLSSLDQRNNIFVTIPANGFFLKDIAVALKIEKWMEKHKDTVVDWFEVVSYFDAMNSLGNYAYNHPEYVFPKLSKTNIQFSATNLGHPLLKEEGRIDNDFNIDLQQFFIITGANMAGKSTFLRTVSLSLVMANMGLPVCATTFSYTPIKLITSMRTTDSLSDNESYFFSELKRLKSIVDTIGTDSYFIILDEILKGTNSTDKAKGSRQFVEKLVGSNSTGVIATHDLSLCEVEKALPQVKNYYFDAEIVNDELFFDYKLKTGVCQNMNASFLLKKMGIV